MNRFFRYWNPPKRSVGTIGRSVSVLEGRKVGRSELRPPLLICPISSVTHFLSFPYLQCHRSHQSLSSVSPFPSVPYIQCFLSHQSHIFGVPSVPHLYCIVSISPYLQCLLSDQSHIVSDTFPLIPIYSCHLSRQPYIFHFSFPILYNIFSAAFPSSPISSVTLFHQSHTFSVSFPINPVSPAYPFLSVPYLQCLVSQDSHI